MKIALFPDDYLPHSTLVHAKMFHELALEFKLMGHEPIIITPSHGYQPKRLQKEWIDGIEVWRFRNPPMRGRGKLRRVISESLLSLNAYLALKNVIKDNIFDVCINYSPTIFFGPLMKWFKLKQKTYIYLVLRDMFPQWIIDEGLISKWSPIAYYFHFFEKINYRTSDTIGLMSKANLDYFSSLYQNVAKLKVLPNWADTTPYYLSADYKNIRNEFGLTKKIIFFYGGNIGHAQDMSNLLRLVKSMKSYKDAHFLFVGQGDEVSLVLKKKKIEELNNLTFIPSVNQLEYRQLLAQVDVGLFSLAKSHKAHNFPGKILGYMAHSLPILGSINEGNDLIDFIHNTGAGKVYINGEDEKLFCSAVNLLKSQLLRNQMGKVSNEVLNEYFSVKSAAKNIINSVLYS